MVILLTHSKADARNRPPVALTVAVIPGNATRSLNLLPFPSIVSPQIFGTVASGSAHTGSDATATSVAVTRKDDAYIPAAQPNRLNRSKRDGGASSVVPRTLAPNPRSGLLAVINDTETTMQVDSRAVAIAQDANDAKKLAIRIFSRDGVIDDE